jgi:hypothetical protein
VPLHASKLHIGACNSRPSAAPTAVHLPSLSHGSPLLIGRPSKKLPPLHLAACCALLGRVSWHHRRSSSGLQSPPHHTTSLRIRCVPRAGSGSRLSPPSLSTTLAHRIRAHSTPLYHHLGIPTFNQRLYFFWSLLSLLSNDIDIKCYDISAHLGFRRDFFLTVQL